MEEVGEEQCPLLDTPCNFPSVQRASSLLLHLPHSVQSHCCHCGWSHRCCRRCCHSLIKLLHAHLKGKPELRKCNTLLSHQTGKVSIVSLKLVRKCCFCVAMVYLEGPFYVLCPQFLLHGWADCWMACHSWQKSRDQNNSFSLSSHE